MTDNGPGFLPGSRPVPYGMTPGVRHVMPGINDGPAPYGMTPGQPHVLPDQIDLDTVKPDVVNLDEPPAAAPLAGGPLLPRPSAPQAPAGPASGWRVKNSKGDVVATIATNPRAGLDYQRLQVQNIGDSLLKQAVTPEEKDAATRATAFGLSLVGSMANDKIQAAIVHRYDEDTGNANKLALQGMRTKNRGGGPAAGAPTGPSKADKFGVAVDKDASGVTEGIIKDTEAQAKLSALNAYEQDLEKLEAMINDPNALSQRAAIAEYMKELTGKQATDMERRQITGAAGMMNKIQNDFNLWNPADASLTRAYRQAFSRNVGTLRTAVRASREKIAAGTSNALSHNPFLKRHADPAELGNYGRGRITGDYGDQEAPADLLK